MARRNNSGRRYQSPTRRSLPIVKYFKPSLKSPISFLNNKTDYFSNLDVFSRVDRSFHRKVDRSSQRRYTVSNNNNNNVRSVSFNDDYNFVNLNNVRSQLERRLKVCARRKVRKEVMHAIRHAGRGGGKPPKYTKDSLIKC